MPPAINATILGTIENHVGRIMLDLPNHACPKVGNAVGYNLFLYRQFP